jgi:hypothetical protein
MMATAATMVINQGNLRLGSHESPRISDEIAAHLTMKRKSSLSGIIVLQRYKLPVNMMA